VKTNTNLKLKNLCLAHGTSYCCGVHLKYAYAEALAELIKPLLPVLKIINDFVVWGRKLND